MLKDFASYIWSLTFNYCKAHSHLKYNLIFLHCICQRGKKLKEGNIHKGLTEKTEEEELYSSRITSALFHRFLHPARTTEASQVQMMVFA